MEILSSELCRVIGLLVSYERFDAFRLLTEITLMSLEELFKTISFETFMTWKNSKEHIPVQYGYLQTNSL